MRLCFVVIVCISLSPLAQADWDFTLADESRITIAAHNLDHREEFLVSFLPPIAGKPLEVEKTDKGVKQATFTLRGYVSEKVDSILLDNKPLITSERFFLYPVKIERAASATSHSAVKSLELTANTLDGKKLKYRVNIQFTPPESIHTPYHLTYIDILQTIFNFQFSLTLIGLNSGALSKQTALAIFPVMGGRLTVEPQFFKWGYGRIFMYSSIFKDPFSNTADVAFSMFIGQLMGRVPIHAGNDFWLTPEFGLSGRSHSIIQNTDNIRIGVTSYAGYGFRSAVVIAPNRLFQIVPQLIFYLPLTPVFGGKIQHIEAGMSLGFRMGDMYYLGLEYNLNSFTVTQVSTYRETYTHFLIHAGTFL